MAWVSAPNIEDAPLEHAPTRFSFAAALRLNDRIEAFLEAERAQLPLWFVAAFASGIAAWLWLPGPAASLWADGAGGRGGWAAPCLSAGSRLPSAVA